MFKMERSNMENRENRKQTKKIAFVLDTKAVTQPTYPH